jgi:hypothetical protein
LRKWEEEEEIQWRNIGKDDHDDEELSFHGNFLSAGLRGMRAILWTECKVN